jgi:DNA polymerase III delta subunit
MQLAQEIHKLSAACRAQGRTEITRDDVTALCQSTDEGSMFALGDALRQSSLVPIITLYRQQRQHEDPLAIAGFLASQIRTLAKIALAYQSGTRQPDAIARATKLHPYVVKLSFPIASKLTTAQLAKAYRALVAFDRSAKDGSAPPELGLLLLIIHLHDTVIGKEARRVAGVA